MTVVAVRERARLTDGVVSRPSPDEASISSSAFSWLCRESARLRRTGAALVHLDDQNWLRLDNYVGVLETPCGTRIEVLPKLVDSADDVRPARALLRRMIACCLNVPARETSVASIQTFNAPLTEWVMQQFLLEFDRLLKRGVRFDYHNVRDEQRFLRGRIDVSRQLRQVPGREHRFQIEHNVFDADRPENRLLCAALDRVRSRTRDADNWRLAQELLARCAEVPRSTDTRTDFRCWRDDRLMTHYRPVRPWCALILNEQSPLSLVGDWRGKSLLFPMERLFERYVEVCLRRVLPAEATLKASASTEHLCWHKGSAWFRLVPDFVLKRGTKRSVLDAKWKLLDASLSDSDHKYGLSQGDFYQLAAYGKHYMDGNGTMMLIFPKTKAFSSPLPEFRYSPTLALRVVPFDLDAGRPAGISLEELL